jgi:hypothetical protein
LFNHLISVTPRKKGCIKKDKDVGESATTNIREVIYSRDMKGKIHAVELEM